MSTRRFLLFPIVGFLVFASAAYALEMQAFLSTPHFEGLYGMEPSDQNLQGWLRIQRGLLGWFAMLGLIGLGLGVVAGALVVHFARRDG